jgi:hypothetical protein
MRRNCETDWAQRFPQYAVSEWIGHDILVSASHYLAVPSELYARASEAAPSVKVAEDRLGQGEHQAAPKQSDEQIAPNPAPNT